LWHFIILLSHSLSDEVLIISHLFNNLEEIRNRNLFVFSWSFNSQQRWGIVNVQKCLHQEILGFVDETLSDFVQIPLVWTLLLLDEFYVFSGRNLPPFFDSLTLLVGPHLMAIGKRVVFTSLSKEIFDLVCRCDEEHFFNLKYLHLDMLGHHDFKFTFSSE
jgi:hypothetical protein